MSPLIAEVNIKDASHPDHQNALAAAAAAARLLMQSIYLEEDEDNREVKS